MCAPLTLLLSTAQWLSGQPFVLSEAEYALQDAFSEGEPSLPVQSRGSPHRGLLGGPHLLGSFSLFLTLLREKCCFPFTAARFSSPPVHGSESHIYLVLSHQVCRLFPQSSDLFAILVWEAYSSQIYRTVARDTLAEPRSVLLPSELDKIDWEFGTTCKLGILHSWKLWHVSWATLGTVKTIQFQDYARRPMG